MKCDFLPKHALFANISFRKFCDGVVAIGLRSGVFGLEFYMILRNF